MDYSSTLFSSMFLDRTEPFPGFGLTDSYAKDEPGDIFKDLPQSRDLAFQPSFGQDDDAFPDWLDLKMDFSMLEGVEASDAVLNDLLLQSDVGYDDVTSGQSLDVLPAPSMESKALPPLDLEQLPYEPLLLSDKQLTPTVPSLELGVMSPPYTPPPSSPDWIVPDMGDPDSPLNLLSPVLPEVGSPAYSLMASVPSPPAPAPAEGTVLTFVAPIVQPVSIVDTAEVIVEAQAVPFNNILSFSMLLGGINGNVQVQELEQVPIETSLSPSHVQPVEKLKKEHKYKAATNRKPRAPKTKKSEEINTEALMHLSAPVSKKERKRKQNKDAAMRYRIKKRMETDTMADEENELLEQNKQLREKAQQLSNELGYLKNLMREMFRAKGLLK